MNASTAKAGSARPLTRGVSLVLIALGLALLAMGGSLTWNSWRAENRLQVAAEAVEIEARRLSEQIRAVRAALASDDVGAAIARSQPALDRDGLIALLREQDVTNVLNIVVASGAIESVNLGSFPGGGFAATEMLLDARSQGSVPAQVHFAGSPDEYLAVVERLETGAPESAVVLVTFPVSVIAQRMQLPDAIDGVRLVQRSGDRSSTLVSRGTSFGAASGEAELPGTLFVLQWNRSMPIGPMTTWQLAGVAGIGLLLFVLGVLIRRRSAVGVATESDTRETGETEVALDRTEDAAVLAGVARSEPADVPNVVAPASPSVEGDGVSELASATRVGDAAREEEVSASLDSAKPEEPDVLPFPAMIERSAASAVAPEPEEEPEGLPFPVYDMGQADRESDDQNSEDRHPEAGQEGLELANRVVEQEQDAGWPFPGPDEKNEESTSVAGEAEAEEKSPGLLGPDRGRSEDENGLALPVGVPEAGLQSSTDAPASPAVGPKTPPPAVSEATDPQLPDSTIFRAYDIRGVVGETLGPNVAHAIGRAVGAEARDRGLGRIAVARDGRLSGADLLGALTRGLLDSGIDVIDVGAVPTPLLYFAASERAGGSGVMVTGSHNPPDYNGFKIMLGGETLAGDQIRSLYERLEQGRLVTGEGEFHQQDLTTAYLQRIASEIQLERPLKVVADCGNGIAGMIAPKVLDAIGAEVIPLYSDVDGTFPNHHPDPGDPETLEDLKLCVRNFSSDLGVAFDGDGDRLGVVTAEGEIIYADRLMMLFARDVLSEYPGAEIIFDVKCSGLLAREIALAGGTPIMARTGHSFLKAERQKRNSPLAGEMSGHFIFGGRGIGFDDGIYAAARLLEILARDEREPSEVLSDLPKAHSTPELKVQMREGEPEQFMQAFRRDAEFEDAEIIMLDGVRADFEDGFGLVRASNTTPILVLRFEGDSPRALARIQAQFRAQMMKINPNLSLPI